MGKCLSCCEQPDAANNHQNKNGDGVKTELSNLGVGGGGTVGGGGSASTGATAAAAGAAATSSLVGGHGHGRRRSSVESSVGSGGHHQMMNNEKRTFYTRIPPVLSSAGGGGEGNNKRLSSHGGRDQCSETKIMALYEQYRDPSEDAILSEGIEHLCRDLDVKPEEFRVLLLAWKFDAETMCRFTRHEFVSGCKCLKVSSIRGIQSRFNDMLLEVQTDADKFKDLYRFTFKFGLDSEIGQRILPVDMAIGLWRLVFTHNEPPILERWLAFLEKHPSVRGIPRDTWNMFLNFLEAVGNDLSSYDDAEAWPSLFDDFVEYENDQTNQNVTPGRDAKVGDDDDDVRVKDF